MNQKRRTQAEIAGTRAEGSNAETRVIPTGCCHDCGGRCVLRGHVRDGKIVRFESGTGAQPQIRACLRGRSYRQRLYSPDRLQYPMRRTGERGSGRFERVSWDEALDETAARMKQIKQEQEAQLSPSENPPALFHPGQKEDARGRDQKPGC